MLVKPAGIVGRVVATMRIMRGTSMVSVSRTTTTSSTGLRVRWFPRQIKS
nr:MAG TPA_asm: hypothetical protein [Caudoviricetes sp.]